MRSTSWMLWLGLWACNGPTDPGTDTTDTDTTDTDTTDTDTTDTDTTDTDAVLPEVLIDTETYTGSIELAVGDQDLPCDASVADAVLGLHTWSLRRGCGFVDIGIGHSNQEVGLRVSIDVGMSAALEEGEFFDTTWDPEAGPSAFETPGSLKLQTGSAVSETLCNDALMNDPVYETTWTPIDGSMRLEVTTAAEDSDFDRPFVGTLQIRGVEVQHVDDDSKRCTLPDITLENLHLGWLPG